MSESMGKETKQNSSKSDKKNINHIDNSIESQTARPGSTWRSKISVLLIRKKKKER